MPSHFYLEKIQKEKQSRLLKLKIYGSLFLFFALVAGIAYLIVYSPLFKIKNITLIYADNPEAEQARYGAGKLITADSLISDFKNFFTSQSKLAQFLSPDNILIWNNEKIDEFLKNYPQWTKILITKDYLEREIKIEIKERERFGIWCLITRIDADYTQINADSQTQINTDSPAKIFERNLGGQAQINADNISVNQRNNLRESAVSQRESASCWWFDKKGILFKEAPSIEGNLINKVDDFSGRSLKVGELALEEKLFSNLIKIFEVLEKSDLKIKSLKLEKLELQEIIADPLNNSFPKIYFSLRIDPKFALAALESLKNLGLEKIEYIDLRVENRAYYKLK